ncbi:hypothetical protein E2605_14895 [Dysgonomonas capnocytophagoides]|uniref:Uncharacterized protein n=1 Tax=Dysgonomonas capnocytophagoides TaxID=45254 RepID=A0A4Y8KX77_9BACT|nr:hypothetical protein [Dysgonomonas capnocytophagoides]TFD94657.1 hypothetical protein E2605_14895 [Dysgonomonas capnocytophagoides]
MEKELIKEVKTLIADVDKTHRYSMSKIYGLSNKVFNKNEQPQSCASCLIRKVDELRKWVASEESKEADLSPANIESVDLLSKSKRKKESRT